MPRMEDIIAYIKSEMDEMEREEFFRSSFAHSATPVALPAVNSS